MGSTGADRTGGGGSGLGPLPADGLPLAHIFPCRPCACWGNLGPHRPPALPPLPQGAFWGLMVGLDLGATRLVLEFLHPAPRCGDPDTRPAILSSMHYLHFAVALFVLSGVVVVAGSLLTSPPQGIQVSLPRPLTLTPDPLRLKNFPALGAPGWCSRLSIRLLISAQGVISWVMSSRPTSG